MPQLDTYLVFDGNCAEAMRFYERTLGGKLETLMTHAESP
ncbi:MAG TPA: VOC family protein, partial [Thermoanaerobaculia bacterium]